MGYRKTVKSNIESGLALTCQNRSALNLPSRLYILLFPPSGRLITLFPLALDVAELPLHLLYGFLVSGILASVVAVAVSVSWFMPAFLFSTHLILMA